MIFIKTTSARASAETGEKIAMYLSLDDISNFFHIGNQTIVYTKSGHKLELEGNLIGVLVKTIQANGKVIPLG